MQGDKLQLEFRSIQVTNAFPGKDGNQRLPGSNWNIENKDELLLNRPNSYGIIPETEERVSPKYVIKLSKENIDKIREDNKNNPQGYEDYNLKCVNEGETCISNYLDTLTSRGVLTINNSEKRQQYDNYNKNHTQRSGTAGGSTLEVK